MALGRKERGDREYDLERLYECLKNDVRRGMPLREARDVFEKQTRCIGYAPFEIKNPFEDGGREWRISKLDRIDPTQVWGNNDPVMTVSTDKRSDLEDAKRMIEQQNEVLNRIKKEPLIVHTVERISKDGKHTYYKKGEQEIRIEAPEGLKRGHEVLIHPKSFQIVEDLGFPPLEASPFAPAQIPDVTWDDIGGLEQAKQDIIEAIELPFKQQELFKFYKKKPVKGILPSGEPGCGKTMLAKAAANSLSKIHGASASRTGFLYVKGPEILDKYVGATEATIRNIFIDADRHRKEHGYPAIVFIDEADAILSTRGQRSNGLNGTVVPAFLTEMDGLEESSAIIILATNRPDVLDPAIVREGRMDRKIHVPRPSREDAVGIAERCFKSVPLFTDIDTVTNEMVENLYLRDKFLDDGGCFADVINGAMITACAEMSVSNAVHRDIKNKQRSGLKVEDVLAAVQRIFEQNRNIKHNMEK
jgi:proteasome ATPase